MTRWSLAFCAAAAFFAAATPANATYQIIKWSSGICQIWDHGIPTKPFPYDFRAVSPVLPTFAAAWAEKDRLWRAGRCLI
jgi:hypothetical protein